MFVFVLIASLLVMAFKATTFYQWTSMFALMSGLYVVYFYITLRWKKLGIPYLTPLPLFGNDLETILGLTTVQDLQVRRYVEFGDMRYCGIYTMITPTLYIKDTGLIETILTKDFRHFTDRGIPFHEKADPLSAHLFNLPGKRWKGLRSKLSPVFTSGKLKMMHQQLVDCADILTQVLHTQVGTRTAINFKEMMSQFTTDVIGTCAYGLNMNSLKDPDNEFRAMGRKLMKTSVKRKILGVLRLFFRSINPKLNYYLGIKGLPTDVNDFFIEMVHATIRVRENNPDFHRNDFIQLLMNLRKEDANGEHMTNGSNSIKEANADDEKVQLDDNMMAANSFLFFVAGFETTASTLTYCLFELARHPEIQEKLYQEVKDVLSKHDGQPTYEAIKNLHYMDMVVSETLRKYPPVPLLFRVCTESYQIPDTDIVLPLGQRIEIPTYALHHDPNIYAEPEDFIPERFSPENKDSIPKGAYLPFGDGPRICIGARFAQMEIKVCLSKVLSKFRIVKSPEMTDVIEFDPKSAFILIPKGGIYMNIVEREIQSQ